VSVAAVDGEPAATELPAPRALVEVSHLECHFPVRAGVLFERQRARVRAVDDVSFELPGGQTLGLVGESGCGKTTLARCLVRLLEPTRGTIHFAGRDITHLGARALRPGRREMQMVFQDSASALNPRRRAGQAVAQPLRLAGVERAEAAARARELLERVGLSPEHADRYPHELSGGQRQRVGIARALATRPRLVVLDEPVSALDVSVRAQIVNLLEDLQDELGLTYLLVAHDLSVVRQASDRVAVMYLGKLVETARADDLYSAPVHPYTAALLAAVPVPDPRAMRARAPGGVSGEPPSALEPPSGCRFRTRCPRATELCREEEPPLTAYPDGRVAACHHPLNVGADELRGATRSPASPRGAGTALPVLA